MKFHLIASRAEQALLLVLQPGVERVGGGAVDVDLGHHREVDVVGQRAEVGDLRGVARLLRAELVAGKAEDIEALVLVFAHVAPPAPRTAGVKPHLLAVLTISSTWPR